MAASIVAWSGAWPLTGTIGCGSQRWVARSPKMPKRYSFDRTVPVVKPLRLRRSMTVGKCRSSGRSRSRIVCSARSNTELAGTPLRSGRTPVIIITWFGMVSITGSDLARGKLVPLSRSAASRGVAEAVISPGLQPSTTST